MSEMERESGFKKRNLPKSLLDFFDKKFDWIVLIIITLVVLLIMFL
jgi:hypothetical protein